MMIFGGKRSEDGVAIIEFAIVLPLLLGIFVALINISEALYEKQIVTQSARVSAQYASVLIDNEEPVAQVAVAGEGNCADASGLADRNLKNVVIQAACNHLVESGLNAADWNVAVSFPKISFSNTVGGGADPLVEVEILRDSPGCLLCLSRFIKSGVSSICTF